jgi:plasmid stabilization system protein ParE
MKVIWTPLAIERLQEIDAYISKGSPTAAINFIALLFERGDSLAEFPSEYVKPPTTPFLGKTYVHQIF